MPNQHHLLVKAQTDRVWTNLCAGAGTVQQQNLLAGITRNSAFPLVKATKLFQQCYTPKGSTVREVTVARTHALVKMQNVLNGMCAYL